MKKLVAASRNQGKLNEIREILAEFPYEVVSMEETGITVDIAETGTTFEENA
jgi:XTP/dITP diphosphohydrolase